MDADDEARTTEDAANDGDDEGRTTQVGQDEARTTEDASATSPLTMADLATSRARRPAADGDPRVGWALLAVLVVALAVLGTVVIRADIDTMADPGWRDNALWAAATAVVLLGAALAVVAWTAGTDRAGGTLARASVFAAVVAATGASVVVAVADDQAGEIARSAPVTTTSGAGPVGNEDGSIADEPLAIEDAFDPEVMAPVALPVGARTRVVLDLTVAGRRLAASAMRCRLRDVSENEVEGIAIGGTWAQPLVVVEPPVDEDGEPVSRCQQVLLRLPIQAGIARPTF